IARRRLGHTSTVDAAQLRRRVEHDIRERDLIPAGGEVVCLVSGGPDSTCLWHVLCELGYRVSALHVDHGLRGDESGEDALFCRAVGLTPREDSSNRDTKRGLIREEILPLLRRLHPDAEGNLYRLAESRRMPPPLADLLDSAAGSKRLDLGSGRVLVREYDQL